METKKILDREIELPDGIKAVIVDRIIKISGEKEENSRKLISKKISVEIKDNKIILKSKITKPSKKEKSIINTLYSHFNNMIKGINEPYVYKLKICSSHFPMSVKLKGNNFEVGNFIGEKILRKLTIKEGANVKIEGDIITVTSTNKEIAGQVAADIEKTTRRPGFDKRIFMDGIYITEKAGVELK